MIRLATIAFASAVLSLYACGAPKDSCLKVGCATGKACNLTTGQCVGPDGGSVGGGSGGSGGGSSSVGGGGGSSSVGGGTGGTGGGSSSVGGGTGGSGGGGSSSVGGGTGGSGGGGSSSVGGGTGGAGGGTPTCTATSGCSGTKPICDTTATGGLGTCVTCTATAGCAAPTPFCLTGAPGGLCVQCRNNGDCTAPGQTCNGSTSTCVSLGSDGGSGGGAGGGGGTFGDGGFPFCVPRDAGVMPCTTECPAGFHCQNGGCVLNGANGQVQVTLRWNTQEDLDLHLDEPSGAGICEIYYGDNNDPDSGTGSSCNATGILDLDSEAACPSPPDFVDIENIIYPLGKVAPSGTYTVRVDHYENCNMSLSAVPFQVEVRVNGVISGMCGVFVPTDADWDNSGGAGDGRQVMTFVVP